MNAYQQRWDIERTVEDGINAVIRDLVRVDQSHSAKVIVIATADLKREITARLQTAYSIRRPRKR